MIDETPLIELNRFIQSNPKKLGLELNTDSLYLMMVACLSMHVNGEAFPTYKNLYEKLRKILIAELPSVYPLLQRVEAKMGILVINTIEDSNVVEVEVFGDHLLNCLNKGLPRTSQPLDPLSITDEVVRDVSFGTTDEMLAPILFLFREGVFRYTPDPSDLYCPMDSYTPVRSGILSVYHNTPDLTINEIDCPQFEIDLKDGFDIESLLGYAKEHLFIDDWYFLYRPE